MTSSLLTPLEFDSHIENKTLRLSFVGMSNAGKSYRAKVLVKDADFLWYQVDEDIRKALGVADQNEFSSWLGYPTSPTYAEREQTYLELENRFSKNAAMSSHGKNLVFDTTGSVIYAQVSTREALREHTLVVHLDVGDDSLAELIEKFFLNRKPLAWHGNFTMEPGETEEGALRRSYPILLAKRLTQYRALAHVNIPAAKFHDASGEDTLRIIRDALSQSS